MRQPKKPREVRHCPHHGKEMTRRKGRQTGKWIWECPEPNCKVKLEGRHVQASS